MAFQPLAPPLTPMSRTLALFALIVALPVSAGCDRLFVADEDRQPAGLRLQPLPGASVDPGESFSLPPAAPSDPLRGP